MLWPRWWVHRIATSSLAVLLYCTGSHGTPCGTPDQAPDTNMQAYKFGSIPVIKTLTVGTIKTVMRTGNQYVPSNSE
jgi:hypothetical protein